MPTKKAQATPIDTLGRECEVSLELGQVVMTAALHHSAISEPLLWDYITLCVERHRSGDWGELDPEDSEANDRALTGGDRVFSSYPLPEHLVGTLAESKLWIITEWDRSSTCILWPGDY